MTKPSLSKDQREQQQLDDIATLRKSQKDGTAGKIRANKDSSIEIPEHHNDRYVYVIATQKNVNPDMKSFSEIASLIPIHAGLFDQMVDQGGFALYDDVKIVHDPRDDAREKYVFKIEHINPQSVESPAAAKSIKTSELNALNEARNQVNAQKATLENKAGELATKETDLATREANLLKMEQELKDREAALKSDGSAKQAK